MACTDTDNPAPEVMLPEAARLPINRCSLPAAVLGGLEYQRHPIPLPLDGVEELHAQLFRRLREHGDAEERARQFTAYMSACFSLEHPEEAGLSGRKRKHATYLRALRGWSFDPDGREAAALKGWVESRFGLTARHHAAALRGEEQDAYRLYARARAAGLYGTNALEAQLDLLYAYAQYELACRHPGKTHLRLYRGVSRVEEHEILARNDKRRAVLLLNNLNSFTATRERADEFGDYILSAEVPLAKIVFGSDLLPGRLQGEDEYMVIGGLYEVELAWF
jgi:NAD+--dinitrogen-reductase ADP-D-ribosyltransferase